MGRDREQRRIGQINEALKNMRVDTAMRWCGVREAGNPCPCSGCANFSAELAAKGFTQAEWEAWKAWRIAQ